MPVIVASIAAPFVAFATLIGADLYFGTRSSHRGTVEKMIHTYPFPRLVQVRTGRLHHRIMVDEMLFLALKPGRTVEYLCIRGRFTGFEYPVRIFSQIRTTS